MKRLLLLSALFLFGCGGGGGTTAGNNPGGAGTLPGGGTAASSVAITLNLVDGVAKTIGKSVSAATVQTATTPPASNHVRVVARQFGPRPAELDTMSIVIDDEGTTEVVPARLYTGFGFSEVQRNLVTPFAPILDSYGNTIPIVDLGPASTAANAATYHAVPDGEIYKKVIDIANPSAQVTVNVPPGANYRFDVLTNNLTGAKHTMLKFGTTPAPITVGSGGTVTIVMNSFDQLVTFSPLALSQIVPGAPDSITSEEKYSLAVTTTGPLASNFKVKQQIGGLQLINAPYSQALLGTPINFKAATSTVAVNLYFEGAFTIASHMLDIGEAASNWTRVYPNETYGEYVHVPLLPVIGTVVPGL